ncbi:MAG: NAD(P)-dependent oxidoreductase, partial [Flavobacteriaceae bacterium]
LVAKGWPLSVMAHRNRKPVDELVAMGASEVETPAEMAARSDIVFICVTASGQVEEVVAGPDGLLDGAAPGMIVVDTSTADPNSTLMLAEKCAARGVRLADAPLGGTPEGAHAGALSAMVGADEETYAAIEPAIMAWAAKSVRLGPVGTGHKMKLINNFVSMGYGAIYAEALSTAAKVGISPRVFDSVIRGSRMDCGFYQTYMRWVLERDPEAHRFALRNAHKDMRYFVAMENAAGIVNPVGAVVKNAFAQAEAAGHGDDDLPKISDIVAAANGVKLA